MAAPSREEAPDVSNRAYQIVAAILSEVPKDTKLRGRLEDDLDAVMSDVNDPLIAQHIRRGLDTDALQLF